MRQLILDTETTGLDPKEGHRLIEIGCIELLDRRITESTYHVYINPDREVDREAMQVHGIKNEFLRDKPRFAEIHEAFLAYITGAELIIHNAPFDVSFINAEFAKCIPRWPGISHYCRITDTLVMAKQKHLGQRNSLDALCKRYSVDNTHREWHGALLDAELLAKVYLAMTGGQASLFAGLEESAATAALTPTLTVPTVREQALRVMMLSEMESKAHEASCQSLGTDVW